jgi:hypothetical protein
MKKTWGDHAATVAFLLLGVGTSLLFGGKYRGAAVVLLVAFLLLWLAFRLSARDVGQQAATMREILERPPVPRDIVRGG